MCESLAIPPLYLLFLPQVHKGLLHFGVRIGVAEDVPPEWQTVIKLALSNLAAWGEPSLVLEEPKVFSVFYPVTSSGSRARFADTVLQSLGGAVGPRSVRAHNAKFFCARPNSAPHLVPKIKLGEEAGKLLQDHQEYAEGRSCPDFDDINGFMRQRNGTPLFVRKFNTQFGAEGWAGRARAYAAFNSVVTRRSFSHTEVEAVFHSSVAEDPKLIERAVRGVGTPRAYLAQDKVLVIPYSGEAMHATVCIKSRGLTVLGQQTKTTWVVVETGAGETFVVDTKRVLPLD